MTSKCGKNKKVAHKAQPSVSLIGRAREKVMRRRDCVPNLDTLLVYAKRHRQMTIKCAYSKVELQCSVLRAHG